MAHDGAWMLFHCRAQHTLLAVHHGSLSALVVVLQHVSLVCWAWSMLCTLGLSTVSPCAVHACFICCLRCGLVSILCTFCRVGFVC